MTNQDPTKYLDMGDANTGQEDAQEYQEETRVTQNYNSFGFSDLSNFAQAKDSEILTKAISFQLDGDENQTIPELLLAQQDFMDRIVNEGIDAGSAFNSGNDNFNSSQSHHMILRNQSSVQKIKIDPEIPIGLSLSQKPSVSAQHDKSHQFTTRET